MIKDFASDKIQLKLRRLLVKTRREHDLLGEREVSADVYYGVHTLRALENFPISNIPISTYPNFIKALA